MTDPGKAIDDLQNLWRGEYSRAPQTAKKSEAMIPPHIRLAMGYCPVWQLQHPNGMPYLTRTVLWGADCLETHDVAAKSHAFVHELHTPDSDRDLHSHPWSWSVSVILAGGYTERRMGHNVIGSMSEVRHTYREGDLNILRHGDYHSIVEVLPGTVTLFLGGAEISDWGFLVDGVHVPHKEYFKQHGGEAMRTVRL